MEYYTILIKLRRYLATYIDRSIILLKDLLIKRLSEGYKALLEGIYIFRARKGAGL
jgi:hypothetical protein